MNETPAAADGPEHRRTHRRRALKEAKVVLSDWTTIDCRVRDLTAEGARLEFGGAISLPEEFRVIIVASDTVVPVRLQWQRGLSAGVSFTGPETPRP